MRTNRSNNPLDDSEILSAAVREGDRVEVDRQIAAHREYLKRVVSLRIDRQIQARVDPSDIVQETQLNAVRRLNEYLDNPVLPLRLWLRRLACDAVVDAQRRHVHTHGRSVKREVVLPEQSSLNIARQFMAGVSSPSREFSKQELSGLIHEAVARLCEADRDVVLLMAFEGLNSSETAQVLGIEAPAVRQRYGRALLKLQEMFVEGGLGEPDI